MINMHRPCQPAQRTIKSTEDHEKPENAPDQEEENDEETSTVHTTDETFALNTEDIDRLLDEDSNDRCWKLKL